MVAVQTERAFQDAVVGYARVCGWRVHHTRPARTSNGWRTPLQRDAGYPDLTLCRPPRLVVVELKSQAGRTSSAQDSWLEALDASGIETYLWRPSQLSEIEEALR